VSLAYVLASLKAHYGKDWVDVATFVTAGAYVLYRRWRRHSPMRLRVAARHMMDGSAVFPLALLSVSVFSRHAVEALLASSRVTLSIAGLFALLSVLSDDDDGGAPPAPRKGRPPKRSSP
jgi:hypothetical protein